MLQRVVMNRAGVCSAISGGSVFNAAHPLISGIPLASLNAPIPKRGAQASAILYGNQEAKFREKLKLCGAATRFHPPDSCSFVSIRGFPKIFRNLTVNFREKNSE